MKHLAKATLCGAFKYSGAMYAQEAVARWTAWPFMAVLLFHRVTDAIPEDGLTVGTRRFRQICKMLQNFNVVPLAEVFRILRNKEPVPPRTVAITFDDCYGDNLFAAQVLAEHKLPACFLVPTGYVGTEALFEWDIGLPPMRNLTWNEVREIADLGFEIGSHSVTHPNFASISVAKARSELADSKKTIEDRLGKPVRWFAYPFGGKSNFAPHLLPDVYETGYEGCLSGFGGFVYPHLNEPVLPRESVPYFQSVLNLEVHLAGCLHWLYSARRRVGMF
jgi:peptidoglycan/xylan/chitin deacetylase (PgdA/CDA1 family)